MTNGCQTASNRADKQQAMHTGMPPNDIQNSTRLTTLKFNNIYS